MYSNAFENLPVYIRAHLKNNILKTSYFQSTESSSYLPVKFVSPTVNTTKTKSCYNVKPSTYFSM